MSNKEHLKSMITNMVQNRDKEVSAEFHSYLQKKISELVANVPKNEETERSDKDNGDS